MFIFVENVSPFSLRAANEWSSICSLTDNRSFHWHIETVCSVGPFFAAVYVTNEKTRRAVDSPKGFWQEPSWEQVFVSNRVFHIEPEHSMGWTHLLKSERGWDARHHVEKLIVGEWRIEQRFLGTFYWYSWNKCLPVCFHGRECFTRLPLFNDVSGS